ncbi:MAG: IS110 family transposase [Acidobacteriaceae bacterium]|nr:IS110 family transposase [Acidobacteriaceae bacterium]
MRLLYRCCAGLDIHRDTVSACIRKRVRGQAEVVIEEQVFGTFTQELERLRSWLKQHKVRQVAMESTGVYWIPVWNVLERGFTLTLVNPATVRALQGQKTDRIDARRIAEYLQYGLLRGSFIPAKPIRELRELTRMRAHIQQDRNRVINRMARLLETVNIKLASVASHIVGASGMAMLRLLARGVCDAERLAACAQGHMRVKIPALVLALDGRPDQHFRWMLTQLLAKLDRLDEERARVDVRVDELAVPYADVLRRLRTIPGVDRTTALVLLAEFGEDMTQFPTAAHLASWAGLCPGNAESAGKRFSGRTRKGDRYVRRILVQSAWGASRCHDCFLAAFFFRTAQRRGLKKAAVAVAHRIAILAWHILAEPGAEYRERGGDFFDRRNPERTARKLSRRLEAIGYKVTLLAPPKPFGTPPQRPARKPSEPVVDASVCPRCARWGMPRCICLVKRKHGRPSTQAQSPL